jgi:hypothetical protein
VLVYEHCDVIESEAGSDRALDEAKALQMLGLKTVIVGARSLSSRRR